MGIYFCRYFISSPPGVEVGGERPRGASESVLADSGGFQEMLVAVMTPWRFLDCPLDSLQESQSESSNVSAL